MRLTAGLFALALSMTLSTVADAKSHRYVGVHAINAEDGMCYIEAPHIHAYAPHKASVLFRTEGGDHHFIGDPVAFGYEGPKHTYHGHHPIVVAEVEHHCYLDGPHYHHHAPPLGARFEIKGDVHWYVGPKSKRYKKHLHRRRAVNRFYAEVHYPRPVIVVEPPVAYADVVVAAPAAHVEVAAPTAHVDVELLVPSVSLVVGQHKHKHYKHKRYKHKRGKHYKHKRYKHKRYKHKRSKRYKAKKRRGKHKRRWRF